MISRADAIAHKIVGRAYYAAMVGATTAYGKRRRLNAARRALLAMIDAALK